MIGIKMSDCKFYVNKEERIVVCVIPNTRHMLYDFIQDNFGFPDLDLTGAIPYYNDGSTFCNALLMPSSFMGKAMCAEDDEWNEDLGRKIAFSRAKDKCYKSFFKRANMFVRTIDTRLGDMIDTFNNIGMKLEERREILENQIEEALYPTKE